MIFVVLGTHEQPFERALDLVTPLAATDELVIQHGHTPARVGVRATWLEFASYDEILGLMHKAACVVSHAGVGTILSALGAGKCPVVLPRLGRFGEHVDDHQLQITRTFAERGIVVPCLEGDDIRACTNRARNSVAAGFGPRGDLVGAVAAATAPTSRSRAGARAWLRSNS